MDRPVRASDHVTLSFAIWSIYRRVSRAALWSTQTVVLTNALLKSSMGFVLAGKVTRGADALEQKHGGRTENHIDCEGFSRASFTTGA